MFVMDCFGHKLYNGVLFAHHLILDVPGGSPHLGYRRRVPLWHNPPTRVNLSKKTRTVNAVSLRPSAVPPLLCGTRKSISSVRFFGHGRSGAKAAW